jgi:lysyl-tRNA synthetase class 2
VSAAARIARRSARWLGLLVVAVAAAPSALGLLYLLRDGRLLAAGATLAGALPLQQLNGDAAQPLLRVALAFASAGLAAGALVGMLARSRALAAALAIGVLSWALLVAGGAASDAIASSLRLAPRLGPQLGHRGLWVEAVALLLGLLAGAWAMRRERAPRPAAVEGHTPHEHERAAQLVAAHGRDTLDPFALREDKAFHFAAGGLLAYRVIGRTAVVAGDPIGPPGSAAAILASFAELAAGRGWSIVATGVSAAGVEAGRACGLRALEIGAEAVVDPCAFGLEGRRVRKVRQAVARVERAGWRIEVLAAGALDAVARAELDAVEARWRARHPRLCGFAMTLGRLWGGPEEHAATYVLARDAAGELRAFLRFAHHVGGLSLDAMRRGLPGEPNGLGETLVVAALRHAAADGVAEVSLNFAGFAHVMAVDPATLGIRGRALRWTLRRLHGPFQLERLVRFNAKFQPDWRPRHLLYRHRHDLPLAALRVLQAEAYLRPPAAVPLPRRWEPARRPVPGAAPAPAALPSAATAGAALPALAGGT